MAESGRSFIMKNSNKLSIIEHGPLFQTMYELLRYISHVPTLVPRATMEDTTLGGYTIPKDTQVMGFVLK